MIERRMRRVEVDAPFGASLTSVAALVAENGGDPEMVVLDMRLGWEDESYTVVTFERLETWEEAAAREAKEAAREELRSQRVAMGLPPDPGHFISSTPPVNAGPGDVWFQVG